MPPEQADTSRDGPQKRKVTLRQALWVLAAQAAVMVGLGLVLWDIANRPIAEFVTLSGKEALHGLLFGAVLIAVGWTSFRAFPRASEALVRMQAQTYEFLGPKLGWPAIVLISLCAGIGEEALFRGGLQTWLGDFIGPVAAIGISSAVFGAIHFGKPAITALLLGVGVIFGSMYWATGSLLTVMIGHATYDIWALRYLHQEFLRLGLVGKAPPLANPAPES